MGTRSRVLYAGRGIRAAPLGHLCAGRRGQEAGKDHQNESKEGRCQPFAASLKHTFPRNNTCENYNAEIRTQKPRMVREMRRKVMQQPVNESDADLSSGASAMLPKLVDEVFL